MIENLKYVCLHSVPRSGSTWLGEIIDSSPSVCYRLQPLFSYQHKSQLNESSSINEIIDFFHDIYYSSDEFVLQKTEDRRMLKPNFKKGQVTHIAYKEVRYHYILENLLNKNLPIKIIGLIRNPLAVISSWLQTPKEFRLDLGWKIEEEWRCAPKKNSLGREEYNGFEKWKEVAYLFLKLKKLYNNRFYLLPYSNLLNDTENEVKLLFDFLEIEYSEQTKRFISQSKSLNDPNPYSVFKQKKKDLSWKLFLPDYIVKEIKDDLEGTELRKFLL